MREREMRPIVQRWCDQNGLLTAYEMAVSPTILCDVVGFRFGERIGRKRPNVQFSVAIELKLEDIAGVINQARRNSHFVNESYAAMPAARIARMKPATLQTFRLNGVGLMAVDDAVQIILPPQCRMSLQEWHTERINRNAWRRCRAEYGSMQKIW